MLNKLLLSTAIVCVSATVGMAQSFSGAELGIEYSDFPDVDDLGAINYHGSAEFEVVPNIGVAADFTFYDFELGDADVSNFTVHGIYSLNNQTKIGAFVGRDSIDSASIDNYGVEVAYDFGVGSVEGYLGLGDDGADDLTYFGASALYGVGSGFSVIADFDRLSFDDSSASTVEIGGEYALAAGPKFSATLGNLTVDDGIEEVDETYFTIAASIGFGPQGGTTFSRKGFFEILAAGGD